MTSTIRFGGAAAVAATVAALALPGAATAAAGKRSFSETYPVASQLCAGIEKGGGPKRLRKSAPQVIADCGVLQGSFNAARAAVLSAEATIGQERVAANALVKAACVGALGHHASCHSAKEKNHKALKALSHKRAHAVKAYYAAVETARVAFWKAIKSLPGGAHLREDARVREQTS